MRLSVSRTRWCTRTLPHRHFSEKSNSNGGESPANDGSSRKAKSGYDRSRLPGRLSPSRGLSLSPTGASVFDTYKFIQRLEAENFPRDQAEAVMASLAEVLQESIKSMHQVMVSKTQLERTLYNYKVDFTSLRSEIALLEKNDFALLKADLSRLLSEAEKLQNRVREDMNAVQSSVRLELSLEKGKIRDEQGNQELKIKETESKIDSEISNLKTNMEMMKWEMFRTLVPLLSATGGLLFAYLRFIK